MATPLTYQHLLDTQSRLAEQGAMKPQTAANRASVLRAFLKHHALSPDAPVGPEFRTDFTKRALEFAEALKEQGRTQKNVTNSLSALRSWRARIVATDTERAIAGDNLPPFNEAFRSLLADKPALHLSAQLSVPRDMVYGWLRGKRPRLSNIRHIHRVERYFGLEPDALASLAGFRGGSRLQTPTLGDAPPVAYRESLGDRTALTYFVKPAVGSQLRDQWEHFVRYKTAARPRLKRSQKGKWRILPYDYKPEFATTWYQYLDGSEVPSAKMGWNKIAGFLGWLALGQSEGGRSMPAPLNETMAWLAVTDEVERYVQWMYRRNGSRYNGSIFEFFSKAASVLRPVTGYLWQLPDLQATLPEKYRDLDWRAMCEETFQFIQGLAVDARKQRVQTRDPRAPIRHILEMDNPLEPVADMIQRLKADRPIGGAPLREAAWARDLVLIKLLVSNPLRLRNLATLTWKADNSGELYQRGDGSWWIRIDRNKFKNVQGAAGDLEYNAPVQEMLWSDLERYLKVYRPRLLTCNTDFLFVASKHGAGGRRTTNRPWADLSRRVEALTRKYLWRCAGVGAHAFRHIVATAIIKASNNCDFKTAALVLHDRLQTVEKNYAYLRSGDGAARMSELLGKTYTRM